MLHHLVILELMAYHCRGRSLTLLAQPTVWLRSPKLFMINLELSRV